jgi:6-phosphogluconate dehydrogenase
MKLDQIKASSHKVKWNLREVHKVTQWKEGCVYRTKSLGLIVCAPDYKLLGDPKAIQVGPPSTSVTRQLM